MQLRKATVQDLPLLKYWDTKQHVIEAGGDEDNVDWEKELLRNVPWQEILIAEIDNTPIGVIVVIDPKEEETHYWGKIEPNLRALDIWIGEESNLGKGYGTQMMKLVLQHIFTDPQIAEVLVDPLAANTQAHRFYEKLGFKRTEVRKFGRDDCFVYRLERNSWV